MGFWWREGEREGGRLVCVLGEREIGPERVRVER